MPENQGSAAQRFRTLSPSGLIVEATPAPDAGIGSPGPSKLHAQTGGGDAYRVAMLEHGYVLPLAPWARRAPGSKTIKPCGLTHDNNWSPWFLYIEGDRQFVGRWCRTCALTEAWEAVDAED